MPEPSVRTVYDRTRTAWRGSGPRPVRIHLRIPPAPPPYPAVLLSHGSGGCAGDLDWAAEGLTVAGYLTAAVEHHGNNCADELLLEGSSFWWERPADLSVALDHLAESYPLAGAGVVGYSLGGYTAAALLGARIDAAKLRRLYAGEPILPLPPDRPERPAQLAQLMATYDTDKLVRRAAADHSDSRFAAAVLLAPAISPILSEESLRAIERPVLACWAEADEIETEGHRYAAIPSCDGEAVPGAHLDFCGWNAEGERMRADLLPRIVEHFNRR
jgi:predicted dienelactone hydrolase